MTPGIGHNSGLVDEPGRSWRKHVWTRARADLLPKLPIEVIRLRVKRAAQLGLPYKTYASVRASTGHDLIGFLFSSNALGVLRDGDVPPGKLARLVATDKVALTQSAMALRLLAATPVIDAAYPAPRPQQSWAVTRDNLRTVIRGHGIAADRYLLVGDTSLEQEWAGMIRTAGYLPAQVYFPPG